MSLQKVNFQPGFNKQASDSGAENQWVDGDFVRFRYGMPEKIGGWAEIKDKKLVGAGRASHTWADLDGRKFLAIGTNKILSKSKYIINYYATKIKFQAWL